MLPLAPPPPVVVGDDHTTGGLSTRDTRPYMAQPWGGTSPGDGHRLYPPPPVDLWWPWVGAIDG